MLVPDNSKHKTALAAKIQLSDRWGFFPLHLIVPEHFNLHFVFQSLYLWEWKIVWVEASLLVYFLSNKTGSKHF